MLAIHKVVQLLNRKKKMNSIRITNFAIALSMLVFAGVACADEMKTPPITSKSDINLPVTELQWLPSGIPAPNGKGALQIAPAYGNPSKGEHGTFVKMPAGYVSSLHTHTSDYFGVVITGVAVNMAVNGKEVPLPPGSYWFQVGQQPHITKCISTNECTFFIYQGAHFDYLQTNH